MVDSQHSGPGGDEKARFARKGCCCGRDQGSLCDVALVGGSGVGSCSREVSGNGTAQGGRQCGGAGGKVQHLKGKLLEWNADSRNCIVQIYEDMSVLTLSLTTTSWK